MTKRLTKQQAQLLELIVTRFATEYPEKYRNGAYEHKGYLGDMSAIDLAYNLLEEAYDQVAYAITLIEKLQYSEEA